jgi:hypothetical protein
MSPEEREIYDVLVARPDIKELFELILSFPKEKQLDAIAIATNYLHERGYGV